MTVFFTSDFHFHDKQIGAFTERGKVVNLEKHNEWLIETWNSQVKAGDLVYHLGDFSFSRKIEDFIEVLGQLNGQIMLLNGNHDTTRHFKKLKELYLITWYGHYKEIKIGSEKVCLFHYPIAAWNGQHRGSWHLFGHSHSTFDDVKGKALDVGLDNAYKLYGEHKLFSEQDISDYMKSQELWVADG